VRLYDTVNSNRDFLSPIWAWASHHQAKGIDDVPIVTLALWTADPERSGFEMQQVARAVEIELKRIKGTRDVTTNGGPGHVIRVIMDTDRMNAFGVTAQDIVAALQVSNASQPGGSLVSGNREILVQTGTYIETAEDVKKLVVAWPKTSRFSCRTCPHRRRSGPASQYVWFGTGAVMTRLRSRQQLGRPGVSGEFPR